MTATTHTAVLLRAHLLRATYEWCTANGYTPYMQVFVDASVQVPLEYVRDGTIVLNVSQDSTHQLRLGDEAVEFQARFNGVARKIVVPVSHVMSLFARETGDGYQAISMEQLIELAQGAERLAEAGADEAPQENKDIVPTVSPPVAKKPVFTRIK